MFPVNTAIHAKFFLLQFAQLELIRDRIDEFRRLALDIVNNACLGALLNAGYTPDDSNITVEQTAYGKLGNVPFYEKAFYLPPN